MCGAVFAVTDYAIAYGNVAQPNCPACERQYDASRRMTAHKLPDGLSLSTRVEVAQRLTDMGGIIAVGEYVSVIRDAIIPDEVIARLAGRECWLCHFPLGTRPDCLMCDAYRKDTVPDRASSEPEVFMNPAILAAVKNAAGLKPGDTNTGPAPGYAGENCEAPNHVGGAALALLQAYEQQARQNPPRPYDPALDPQHIKAHARAHRGLAAVPELALPPEPLPDVTCDACGKVLVVHPSIGPAATLESHQYTCWTPEPRRPLADAAPVVSPLWEKP
jgi:hypothetical protein